MGIMGDVPSYSELGKNARNVLRSGYHYGKSLMKIAVKTKTARSLEVGSDFTINFDDSKSVGSIRSKYKTEEYGSLTEKWTTDGTVTTEYSVDEIPKTGCGMTTAFNYRPTDGEKSMKLDLRYKNDCFNAGATITNAFDSEVQVLGAFVTAFKKVLIGLEGGYDSASDRVTRANVGVDFNIENVGVHMACNNIPYEYDVSLFYQVNSQWDVAFGGIFATNGNTKLWTAGVGARYKFDQDSAIRFKFNKDLQIGTSLEQKIHDGVKVTLSMNFDSSNPTRGEHKVGLALEFEA